MFLIGNCIFTGKEQNMFVIWVVLPVAVAIIIGMLNNTWSFEKKLFLWLGVSLSISSILTLIIDFMSDRIIDSISNLIG